MVEWRHKRGDTFAEEVTLYADEDMSVPYDLSGWTVNGAAVKHVTGQPGALSASITDASSGRIQITASASDTAAWLLGVLHGDVEFSDGAGTILSTETFTILLEEDYA